MDRVFLDANVLFSAAYRPDAGIKKLWSLKGVKLVTSAYACMEAEANLSTPEQLTRLRQLIKSLEVIDQPLETVLPKGIDLPEKDHPILLAALQTRATHLLTGDFKHFGKYYGKTFSSVLILTPGEYLRLRQKS